MFSWLRSLFYREPQPAWMIWPAGGHTVEITELGEVIELPPKKYFLRTKDEWKAERVMEYFIRPRLNDTYTTLQGEVRIVRVMARWADPLLWEIDVEYQDVGVSCDA